MSAEPGALLLLELVLGGSIPTATAAIWPPMPVPRFIEPCLPLLPSPLRFKLDSRDQARRLPPHGPARPPSVFGFITRWEAR
jgi:hypothetical protein